MNSFKFKLQDDYCDNHAITKAESRSELDDYIYTTAFEIWKDGDGRECGYIQAHIQYTENGLAFIDGINFDFSVNDAVYNSTEQLNCIHAFYDWLRVELESRGWSFGDKPKKTEKIVCKTYGREQVFDSREKAIEYFKEWIFNTDGSEQSRGVRVLMQLEAGETYCTDEE